MPDSFDANGLQVKTAAEITSDLTVAMQNIYGADINVEQNSPDGQFIGIMTQMCVDIRELIVQINAGFDPDQAVGAILDQRVAFNDIQREGGTYTIQPVDIVTNRTVELDGLDGNFNNPLGTAYTVQDDNANEFILIDSVTLLAGTTTVSFRAQQIGAVNVPIDTIINPVTIITGVISVNNSSAAITVGEQEETDPQLRTRRQRSVALASNGYLNGLLGTVLNLPGVTEAALYENVSDNVDANGIPAHGIWLIVDGGADSDIANAIYTKKSYGANMKGAVTEPIITASGGTFVAAFDRSVAENLYIAFTIKTTVANYDFDLDAIKAYIANALAYSVGQAAETSAITTVAIAAIASQGGGGVPVLMTVSTDGITYTDYITTATLASKWTLDPSRITITVVA